MSGPPDVSRPESMMATSDQTMMADRPAFTPSGRAWRPYKPAALEPISRRAQELVNKLLEFVPGPSAQMASALSARFKQLFDVETRLYLDHVHVVKPKDLHRRILMPTYLAAIAPAPDRAKGLLDIDLTLAHAAVDVLLGGTGDTVMPRPLTDTEEGMMGFVVLEALRCVLPSLEAGFPSLRFEGPVHSIQEAQDRIADEEQLLVLQFKGTLGSHAGFVRLFVPGSVVGLVPSPSESAEKAVLRRQALVSGVGRLAGVRTTLRCEIGRAMISADDLKGVRLKDVVLIEECTARPDKGQGGHARLKLGAGKTGFLEADVLVQTNRLSVKIKRFVSGETPRILEDSAEERQGNEVEPSENEGAELLNDIPLQVAVEIARVGLSAEEVVALKAGQVLDLKKSAGEPVELSVNGKLVARGELVEIEGNLGVRISAILG